MCKYLRELAARSSRPSANNGRVGIYTSGPLGLPRDKKFQDVARSDRGWNLIDSRSAKYLSSEAPALIGRGLRVARIKVT